MANDVFQSALVKKPKRSRFDFSHSNSFGMKIGLAYPTETRFIVPGDEVSVSMSQVARLAPMPVPTFADLKVRHDWFFVPCRLMYNERDMSAIFGSAGDGSAKERSSVSLDGFVNLLSAPVTSTFWDAIEPDEYSEDTFLSAIATLGDFYVPGSLFDFLGYPVPTDKNAGSDSSTFGADLSNIDSGLMVIDSSGSYDSAENGWNGLSDLYSLFDPDTATYTSAKLLLEPVLAYHFIWRDWYRFTGVQDMSVSETYLENHCLSDTKTLSSYSATDYIGSLFNSATSYVQGTATDSIGSVLGRLRQVHLAKDMFTSVRYGSKPTVLIPTGDNANIPTLREASAIQRFIDLVSIVGSRYFDKVKALFNVKATGFADDRVQFLARYQQYIKIGEVITTATTDTAKTGDYSGRGILIDGKYLFKRRFDEPGWLMCITSVVPDIAYTGLSRQLSDTYFVDTPVPSLAEIGDQTVFNREVDFSFRTTGDDNDQSYGDQFRYYAYKSAPNEVHGSFKMSSMRSWVPTQDYVNYFDVIGFSKVSPIYWNKFFNDMTDSPIFGDRFFFKVDFNEFITRQLPKYINYHL